MLYTAVLLSAGLGLPDGLDGLLGMNLLRHFHFEVDKEQHRLHLQPRESQSP